MIDLVRKILKVFDENKLWDEGIELIGSWAFNLYQNHFGVKPFPLRTVDIDFLIPIPYRAKEKVDLIGLLTKLGFEISFNSDGSIYLWNSELKIEFITPERGKGADKAKEIKALSIKAIPLRFMDLLLDDQVRIKEGTLEIAIPSPTAFAIHKLLISGKRKNSNKKLKDMEQALLVLEAVNSKDLKKMYGSLPKPWKKSIINTLNGCPSLLPLRKEIAEKAILTLQSQ